MNRSTIATLKRAADACKTPKAFRGMFAVLTRRYASTRLWGETTESFTYTPCRVTRVGRDGIAKQVTFVDGSTCERRDAHNRAYTPWFDIMLDSRGAITDVDGLLAKLIDESGAPLKFDSLDVARDTIRNKAGL
jgi:hypothetical protein